MLGCVCRHLPGRVEDLCCSSTLLENIDRIVDVVVDPEEGIDRLFEHVLAVWSEASRNFTVYSGLLFLLAVARWFITLRFIERSRSKHSSISWTKMAQARHRWSHSMSQPWWPSTVTPSKNLHLISRPVLSQGWLFSWKRCWCFTNLGACEHHHTLD